MIDRLRRLFRRDEADPVEDLVSQYVDSESEFDRARIVSNLHGSGIDAEDLQSIREVAEMLRSSDTVEAPRSYALTPETLAARGFSEDETAKILDPRSGRGGLRLRTTAVYVPLAIAVVALAGVALLTIGDLSEYVTDRFDSGGVEVSTVIVERAVQSSDAPSEPGTPGEPGLPTLVQTVVVEKEVIVVHTVIVEKQVQVAGETVIQTVEVEKIVEKEVVVEVEKLVEIEKIVEVEREVVVEVEVEKEVIREVEALPTPVAARAEMAAEAMTDAGSRGRRTGPDANSDRNPVRHTANRDADPDRLSRCIHNTRTHCHHVAHSHMHPNSDPIAHADSDTNSDTLT